MLRTSGEESFPPPNKQVKKLPIKIVLFFLVLIGIGAAFFLVPQKRPFGSYLKRAEEAFQDKNFNRAIELNLKALRLYPKHERTPEVLLSIGDIYNFSLNNQEKAGKAYEMLTQQFPKTIFARKAFQNSAEMYEKSQQYQNALLAYQGILDHFPYGEDIDMTRFKVALMALKLKKFEPARRSLMQIIEKNPQTPIADQVLYQLGTAFFMEGAIRESIQVLEVAAEKYPDSPLNTEMKFTLANGYEEMGVLDKALKVYREIRLTYPNPKVVEKKIEKITEQASQEKKMKEQILAKAKKDQAGGKGGAETKPSPKSPGKKTKETKAATPETPKIPILPNDFKE